MRFLILPLCALTLSAQPSFEVASIRPANTPNTPKGVCGEGVNADPASPLSAESLLSSSVHVLSDLLTEAYYDEVDDFELPDWTRSGPFAVNVKIPPNTTVRACRKMLQSLLAERFHAVASVETREVTRYHLRVAKSGLKLKPVAEPPADLNASVVRGVTNGRVLITFRGAPISRVLNNAIGALASRVALTRNIRISRFVDETGLTGFYDGEFEFDSASLRDGLAESLEDALTRQLGLTLELRKAPGKVLVLRSSDRTPTEN